MPELIIDTKKPLQSVYGDSPITRVIDFFMKHPEQEFTISGISDGAEVARTTLWNGVLEELLNNGFLIKTREIGNAKLFALNKESHITKFILYSYKELVEGGKYAEHKT